MCYNVYMSWKPLEQIPFPKAEHFKAVGGDDLADDEAWTNDLYQVFVKYMAPPEELRGFDLSSDPRAGFLQLSIKRHDRDPARDWRHLQQIKNEVAGPEREALELFPRESRLMDTANQYHLWVFPEGLEVPVGYRFGHVTDREQTKAINRLRTQGVGLQKQRPWEEGLTTGRNELTTYQPADAHAAVIEAIKKNAGAS